LVDVAARRTHHVFRDYRRITSSCRTAPSRLGHAVRASRRTVAWALYVAVIDRGARVQASLDPNPIDSGDPRPC
jgi:hypothetical protein